MEYATLVVVASVTALLGGVIGWFARSSALSRALAIVADVPRLQSDLTQIREDRDRARLEVAELSAVAKQVLTLQRTLDEERRASGKIVSDLASLQATLSEREAGHKSKLAEIQEMGHKVEARFSELAVQALGDAQGQFLKRADDRFRQSEEKSSDNLKALLQPVTERLQRYEEGVAKVEHDRTEAYGALTSLIGTMREGQDRVQAEAAKLVNSLRSAPKARGRWGEQQLRNVLETCGLSEHSDFQTEITVDSADGRFRPDVIIRIPGARTLVIDAKVSLNSFQDAFHAVEDAQRSMHLTAHAASMKAHINTLGSKDYQSRFADTADYVVMFVPGEHFVSAALEQEPYLWDYALERRVLLATPTNLIAIARTLAAIWRQEKLATDARKIADLGKELYERLSKAAVDLKKVGGGLTSAVTSYNSFVSRFESRTLVSARRFRDLNIEPSSKDMDEVTPVEVVARYNDFSSSVSE